MNFWRGKLSYGGTYDPPPKKGESQGTRLMTRPAQDVENVGTNHQGQMGGFQAPNHNILWWVHHET